MFHWEPATQFQVYSYLVLGVRFNILVQTFTLAIVQILKVIRFVKAMLILGFTSATHPLLEVTLAVYHNALLHTTYISLENSELMKDYLTV